ncbi:unnamed protein product, partial [Scytosiphon promiscuus]
GATHLASQGASEIQIQRAGRWKSSAFMVYGKYDEAEPLNARAIAIGEKVLGPEHPDLA